jgi:pyrroline-5-carboxylate reductase
MNILFLGGGNMATAMMGGLKFAHQLAAVEIVPEARQRLLGEGYQVFATLDEVNLHVYDVIVIAVKPQQFKEAVAPLAGKLKQQLVLSIAAGITLPFLSTCLGGHTLCVRAMPNTPALVGMGMTGIYASSEVGVSQREMAAVIASAFGQVLWVKQEEDIDAITAISGSGPAYVFAFMESMMQAAQDMGFSEEQAKLLTLATFAGATSLAQQSVDSPAVLREKVTSKGGTTAAALACMQEDEVHESLLKAMQAARVRSVELGQLLSL